MGLGTKIKEAMHGDKDTTTRQSPTSTSHTTPGAFPADDVPRTHQAGNLHKDTTTVPSAGEPRTEKLHGERTHGKHSPDYTHSSTKDSSLTGTGVPHSGTTTTGSHHNKLQKDGSPYWGDHERPVSDEYGTGVGGTTHGRTHNEGLTGSHHGTTGMTGNTHGAPMTGNTHGTTGMTGSEHGMSGSNHGTAGMAGAGAATGAAGMAGSHHMSGSNDMTGTTHGMGGNNHGTPGMMTGATGSNDRYDDRINPGVPTTGGAHNTTGTGSSGGMASNLPHRPADVNNTHRDYKVDEYDAPTNSSGRGKQGLAGAAGGVAASELAHRHHNDDMRDYNTDRGLNTAEKWHNTSGTGAGAMGNTAGQPGMTGHHNSGSMLDPVGTTHGDPMTGGRSGSMGNSSSMLDPHNTTGRTTYGHENTHGGMMGGNDHVSNSRVAGENLGSTHGTPGMTGSNHGSNHGAGMAGAGMAAGAAAGAMAGSHGNNHSSHGMTGHDSMTGNTHGAPGMTGNTHGAPGMTGNTMGHDNTVRAPIHPESGMASSQQHGGPMGMGGSHNMSSGMGDGHMGPGHAAAKVMHRCDHCGNDNDISKYFSKEAVYRMS